MLDKRKLKSIDEILNKEVTNSKGETMKLSEIPRTAQPSNTKSSSIKKTTENKNKSNNNKEYKNYGLYAREGIATTKRPEITEPIDSTSILARAANAAIGIEKTLSSTWGLLSDVNKQAQESGAISSQLEMQKNAASQLNYLKNYKHKGDTAGLEADPEYQLALKKLQSAGRVIQAYRNRPADTSNDNFNKYAEALQFRDKALEGLTGTSKFIGEGLYSVAQTAAVAPAAIINPAIPLVILGTQAAADKAYETAISGKSANEAFSRGLISGGIEAATEKIGLDNAIEAINALRPAGESILKNIAKNIVKQSATEGAEEGASYLLNYAADKLAKDENAQFSTQDLLYSAGLGAFSGGLMGTGTSAINLTGEALSRNTQPDINDIADIALQNQLNEQQVQQVQQPQIQQEQQIQNTAEAINEELQAPTIEQQNTEDINNNQIQPTQPLETVNKNSVTNKINNQEEAVQTDSETITGDDMFDTTRYGAAGKNEIVKNYDNSTSSEEYQEEFDRYYNMGLRGESTFEEMQNTKSPILNENQKTGAWLSGVADVSSANSKRKNLTLPTAQEAEMLRSQSPVQGFDRSENERIITQTVGSITGLKINLVKDLDYNANALYSQKRGEINISIKGDGFLPSLGHEVLHFLRDYNPEGYTELRDIVLKFAATSENKSLDRYIEDYRRTYEKAGDYTNEQLTEEITADAMQKALENDSFIDYISRRKQSLGQRIIDFLKDVATSIKNAISGIKSESYNQYSEISEDIEKNYSDVKGLYTKFYNAMEKAGYEFKKGYEPTDIFDENFITENNTADNLKGKEKSTTGQVNSQETNKETAENEKDIKFFENEGDLENILDDFSLTPVEQAEFNALKKENTTLKEQVKYLSEQLKITEGVRLSSDTARKTAQKILKRYGSKYNTDTLQNQLIKLSEYIGNGQNVDGDRLLRAATGLAKKILSESEILDKTQYNDYSELRNYLKAVKIKVSNKLKSEIDSQYDSYNNFRKQNFGRLNLST